MDLRAGRRTAMGLARRVMRRLVDFYRELDRGLAVMRGEETVAGHTPGIDWTRKRGAASDRRCRRERSAR